MLNSLDVYLNRFLKKRFGALDIGEDNESVVFDKRFFNYIGANQDEELARGIVDYIALYLARRGAIKADIKVTDDGYLVNYRKGCV